MVKCRAITRIGQKHPKPVNYCAPAIRLKLVHLQQPYKPKYCLAFARHVAKTETTNRDMNYISVTKLARRNTRPVHRNQHVTSSNSTTPPSQDLPLFEQLSNRDAIVSKLLKRYRTDMWLFGYKLSRDPNTGEKMKMPVIRNITNINDGI